MYFFAYNQYCNVDKMTLTVGKNIVLPSLAVLLDYEILLNAGNERDLDRFLNIREKENSKVYGRVFNLTEKQIAHMELMIGSNFYRFDLFDAPIKLEDEILVCKIPIAYNNYITDKPGIILKTLLDLTLEGLQGAPKEYIEKINQYGKPDYFRKTVL